MEVSGSLFVVFGVYDVDLEMDLRLRFPAFLDFLFVAFAVGVNLGMDFRLCFPAYFWFLGFFFVALGVYSVNLEMDPWLRFSISGFLFVAFTAGIDLGMDF
ncbi:hypothetical protein C2G38_2048200 [Gigaspora rosea]|uniref:Uncharacterized protein n=1 Tax=Gigaspora rosea TaxID=44941 RepID=A0A397U3C3_9GLOM|nr:hypothetical protein C2G38_2048200 [Gigaspora rosea]